MIHHCYVVNELFTHPSDKWMVCVATIMFIYSQYIQVASQVPKQVKSFGIKEISRKSQTHRIIA